MNMLRFGLRKVANGAPARENPGYVAIRALYLLNFNRPAMKQALRTSGRPKDGNDLSATSD
jgi:hypothetical protein